MTAEGFIRIFDGLDSKWTDFSYPALPQDPPSWRGGGEISPPRKGRCDCPFCRPPLVPSLRPSTPAEELLFAEAARLGFRLVPGPEFDCVYGMRVIHFVAGKPEAERVLCLAHELGHAIRLEQREDKEGWIKQVQQFNQRFLSGIRSNGKPIMLEELLAWREGLRILRRLRIRVAPAIARRLRNQALGSYRISLSFPERALRAAAVSVG